MFKAGTTVSTRRGRKVEILAVLSQPLDNGQSIVGILTDSDGSREVETWELNGRYSERGDSLLDLRQSDAETPIVTNYVYPPIPIRRFDWCAYFYGDEECGLYGWGATEAEAIANLRQLAAEAAGENAA